MAADRRELESGRWWDLRVAEVRQRLSAERAESLSQQAYAQASLAERRAAKQALQEAAGCSSHGGDFSNVTQWWVRLFPWCGRKRVVRVLVDRIYGASHHLYVKLNEEANPLLCECGGALHLHSAWGDEEAAGIEIDRVFKTDEAAQEFVRTCVAEFFPPATHRLLAHHWQPGTVFKPKWLYREGD